MGDSCSPVHRFGIDGAWIEVRQIEPDDLQAQATLVRRVVSDLLDEGLVFGAFASRDDGYNLADTEFVPVPREVVETEPARPLDYIAPEDHLLWLIPTERAEEVWQSLPPEAYLDPRSTKQADSCASAAPAFSQSLSGARPSRA